MPSAGHTNIQPDLYMASLCQPYSGWIHFHGLVSVSQEREVLKDWVSHGLAY